MYASGLKLGLTTQDLLEMPVNRLANIMLSLAPTDTKDEAREATQKDIDALR